MLDAGVGRVFVGRVPARLEFAQRGDQRHGRLDRVDSALGLENVNRDTAQMHLQPDDADLRIDQVFVERFGNDHGIGAVAALKARQRAVARALFLDDGLQADVGGGCEAGVADRVERIQVGRHTALHIAGTAPEHPAVPDRRFERRGLPHVERPGRHDVDVPVQNQRPAAGIRAPTRGDDVDRIVVAADHGRKPRQPGNVIDVDRPGIGLVAALPELRFHESLRRLLLAASRRMRDEFREKRHLLVEAPVHGIDDRLVLFVVHSFDILSRLPALCRRPRDRPRSLR